MASKPERFKIGRIVRCRKDGEDIDYTDYKGEDKTGRYAPVGVIFSALNNGEGDDSRAPLMSFLPEENFPGFDKEEEFYNLYFEDGVSLEFDREKLLKGGKDGRKGRKASKPAKSKARRDEPAESEEDDSDIPF